jgi:hypothetical protein
MQNKEINNQKKESDKIKLLDHNKEDKDEDGNELTKLQEDYERLLKMDEEDHLTHLTRCIKCGKKIEMYTYFCNSACDDQFIKEKEKEKEK